MPDPTVLFSSRLFMGGADVTGASNKLVIAGERVELDVTTFLPLSDPDCGWQKVTGGVASAAVAASGFWGAGDPGQVDDAMWAQLGGQSAWTANPIDTAVGSIAWIINAMSSKYDLLGQLGQPAPWAGESKSTWPAVRGKVAHPPGTARTTTGTGTAVQGVATTSGQSLYAALHVLSIAGTSTPTVTVKIQSDVDGTFASPADRITFTAATAVGGQIKRSAGANADTWYRAAWTITGTSPSFLFLASFGVF